MGPAAPSSLRTPGSGDGPRRFLFFGQVEPYKGVEDLLTAFSRLPESVGARLTIAGRCRDPDLRRRLTAGRNVRLRLEYIPACEVTPLMAEADSVVLPFRQVTTSGSAELALAHGRPLIVPDLPGLAGLPEDAVIRYDGSVDGLVSALAEIGYADRSRVAEMSAAALRYSEQASWHQIATVVLAAMQAVVGSAHREDTRPRAAASS